MIDDTEIDERITASLQRLGEGVRVDDGHEFRRQLAMSAPGRPLPQRRRLAFAIAAVAVVFVAATAVLLSRRAGTDRTTVEPAAVSSDPAALQTSSSATSSRPAPDTIPSSTTQSSVPEPESISAMPAAPIAGRITPASVWTGTEMIVWGGYQTPPADQMPDTTASGRDDLSLTVLSDGAAFDPATRTWRVLPAAPIEGGVNAAATWTGTEMIVVVTNQVGALSDLAAAYNPATNTWRKLPTPPLTAAAQPLVIAWTGTEAIVVGGVNTIAVGAAYDPATDTWRPIADAPGRLQPPLQQLVWTGSRALTILQSADDGIVSTTATSVPSRSPNQPPATNEPTETTVTPDSRKPQLAAYDPATDTWTITSALDSAFLLATPGGQAAAIIIGVQQSTLVDPAGHIIGTFSAQMPAGAAFVSTGVWDGREALWLGGGPVIALDPTAGRWRTYGSGSLPTRFAPVLVWTGTEMLAWGGELNSTVGAPNDGIIYHPPAPSQTTPTNNVPATSTEPASAPVEVPAEPTNSSVPDSVIVTPTVPPGDSNTADAQFFLACTDIEGDTINGPIAGTSLTVITTALATRTPTIGVNDKPGGSHTDPIIGLAAIATDGSTIVATIDRKGPDDLAVTSDHGTTWTTIGTVPDATHLAIAADGSRVAVSSSGADGDEVDIFTLPDGGHHSIRPPAGTSAFDAITFATTSVIAAAIEQGAPSEFANPATIQLLDLGTEQWSSAPAETNPHDELITSILRSGTTLSYTALDFGSAVSGNTRLLTIASDGTPQPRLFELPQLPILINDNGNTITIAVADDTGTYHLDQLTSLLADDGSGGSILGIGCVRPGAAPNLNADPDKS